MANHARISRRGRKTRRAPKAEAAPSGKARDPESNSLAMLADFPALVWRAGLDGRCNYFNKTWLEFTGRRLEQELGDGWAEGVHPDDRERCVRDYLAAFKAHRPFVLEYRLCHCDGRYRWIRDIGRPLRDRNGEFAGYIGGCFDLTERRHADARSQETEARLTSFINHSPSVAFIKDLQGRYLNVNREFLKRAGRTEQQVVGKTDDEIFNPGQAAEFRAIDRRVVEGGVPIRLEETAQYVDGLHVSIVSKFPIRDADGVVAAVGGTKTDITERKQAEKALSQSEEALRSSERQLREALEERERLFRDLHDGIVQEIYAIGMDLEDLQRQLGTNASAARQGLPAAIARLNQVIREVRRHITEGSAPRAVDSGQLVVELRELARAMAGGRQLKFRLDMDSEATSRLSAAAADHVLNIVREAMSNCVRHSNGSNGWVSLRAHRGGVRILVEDDGIGFDPQAVEPERRGLRNIAARARELGAQLDIHASPGGGTRLVVDIPMELLHGAA